MSAEPSLPRAWWPRPTMRGVALFGAGAALFLYGLLLERRDALFVGCFLALVPVVAMGYVLLRRVKLQVTRTFSPLIVAAGTESIVGLVVRNQSSRPSYGTRWRDQAEAGIPVPRSALLPGLDRSGSPDGRDTLRLEYTLVPRRRGVYGIGPLVVSRSDPFGLAVGDQVFGEPHDLVVTPRVTPLPGNALSLSNGDGSLYELVRHTNPNADELIAREYRPGDPLRRMNWPATARHGELMVRQEEQRSNPEARLVIDTAASGSGSSAASGAADRRTRTSSSFEVALEMAASIGVHLLEAGFALDVVETGPSQLSPANDRRRGGLRGDSPTTFRVPAGDREFLEGLANLTPPTGRQPASSMPDSPGSAVRDPGVRIPTFAVLVDPDERDTLDLAALKPYSDPAVAFVADTVRPMMVDKLEDAGWFCVRIRGSRSIAQSWLAVDGREVLVDEAV